MQLDAPAPPTVATTSSTEQTDSITGAPLLNETQTEQHNTTEPSLLDVSVNASETGEPVILVTPVVPALDDPLKILEQQSNQKTITESSIESTLPHEPQQQGTKTVVEKVVENVVVNKADMESFEEWKDMKLKVSE